MEENTVVTLTNLLQILKSHEFWVEGGRREGWKLFSPIPHLTQCPINQLAFPLQESSASRAMVAMRMGLLGLWRKAFWMSTQEVTWKPGLGGQGMAAGIFSRLVSSPSFLTLFKHWSCLLPLPPWFRIHSTSEAAGMFTEFPGHGPT